MELLESSVWENFTTLVWEILRLSLTIKMLLDKKWLDILKRDGLLINFSAHTELESGSCAAVAAALCARNGGSTVRSRRDIHRRFMCGSARSWPYHMKMLIRLISQALLPHHIQIQPFNFAITIIAPLESRKRPRLQSRPK